MTGDADELKTALLTRIEAASDLKELDDVRVEALGKKGRITEQMKGLGALDPEARKAAGQALNVLKETIATAIEARKFGHGPPAPDQPDPGRDHRDLW